MSPQHQHSYSILSFTSLNLCTGPLRWGASVPTPWVAGQREKEQGAGRQAGSKSPCDR
jgi:hypothetical protein